MVWTTLIGNEFENRLLHIFEDRDGNILVSGVSIDYGQEDFSLSFHKTWFPFFTLLDHAGNEVWENFQDEYSAGGATAVNGSCSQEQVKHVIQGVNGNYMIAMRSYNFVRYRALEYSGLNANIVRIRTDGQMDLPYKFDQTNSFLVLDGMVMNRDDIQVMCYEKPDGTQIGNEKVITLDPGVPLRFNAYDLEYAIGWPWNFETVDAEKPTVLNNGDLVFSVLKNGNCYALGYTPGNYQFRQGSSEGMFSGIVAFHHNKEGEYVFSLDNKDVVFTDSDFKILSTFNDGFEVKELTTLNDGSLLIGVEADKSVTLVKYMRKGNAFEAE